VTQAILHGSSRLAEALGISRRQLDNWAALGIVRPARIGGLNRAVYAYCDVDVLAAALARELRRRGFGLPQAVAVADWIRGRSLEDLQDDWAQGRTLLFVVGDNDPLPRLLTREDIFHNEGIELDRALAAGVPVCVVDTREAYQQMHQKLGTGQSLEAPAR
jgi:hypothetical protein